VFERKDSFYHRAKAEGYRSRAAYKLLHLNGRYHLLKRGDSVVDLGSAPGGWLQVALELVGKNGRVIGVDLLPVQPFRDGAQFVIHGDFRDEAVQRRIVSELGGKADVVLSDLSPNLSGIKHVDDARAIELALGVFKLLPMLLARKGNLLLKFFVGPEFSALGGEFEIRFQNFKTTRPEATRKGSSEVYFVGLGYLATEARNG
jgi:23S rRNA (uridine2552-2'-O)-methyltransferase